MKKLHLLLVLMLLGMPAMIFAQNEDELPEEPLTHEVFRNLSNSFSPGEDVFVFGDKINVRAAANPNAAVLTQLLVGEKVKIRDTAQISDISHYQQRWCHVEFVKNGARQTGFVWGGLLALGQVEMGTTTLLFGVTNAELAQDGKSFRLEVRAAAGGKVLSSVSYQYFMDDFFYTRTWKMPNLGLKKFQGGIKINTSMDACGYESSDLYVFWDGKQLVGLPRISSVADGGVFFHSEQYIFPFQQEEDIRDGVRLLLKIDHGETLDNDDELAIEYDEYTKVRMMKWDGKQYIKPKID